MSPDFQRMMGWLSHEVVQGLSFNAGSTFDPPNELRAWHMQPDISLGVGMIPLNKTKFPAIQTQALAEKKPENMLPNSVTFPHMALHVRLGLPRRWDMTIRVANMTAPKGYKLTASTTGSGQSNSLGIGVRRHFLGRGDNPLVSVAANYNHVRGHFNFQSLWERLELAPGFQVDSRNTGRLEWNVNSFGVNAVLSQTYGMWTPFAGAGWNYMTGSMKARLQADFASPLFIPAIGEASDHPEQHQARVIFGTQLNRSICSWFVTGEIKAIGIQAGHAMIAQMGVVTPFRIGSDSLAAKGTRRLITDDALAGDSLALDEEEKLTLRSAPANVKPAKRRARRADPKPRGRQRRGKDELPEMIFIQ